jgi:vitamin B12 transporter
MSSSISVSRRRALRRRSWLISAMLGSPLAVAAWAPAFGQQEVSPNVQTLPTIVVSPAEGTPAEPPAVATGVGDPVVVSPTAIPTPAAQVGSSVTVITAADMERDQQRTAPDALRTVPGLHVLQAGGPGSVTSVFLRGTNPNHVKVFVDGIDVSDPSNINRTFDLGQLLTGDIERIEVLRGPQSGLYGADALGGVISIVTKRGSGPPKVTGTLEGGSFGTFNQTASLSGGGERFNYAFNVLHFRSTDTPVTPLELLPPGRRRINDFYENWTGSMKAGADLTENLSVNVVARYTDTLLRFTGDDFTVFPAVPSASQSTQHLRQFFTRGEAVWSLFDGAFVNRFSAAYTDHWSFNTGPDVAPRTNSGDRTKVEWRGDLKIGAHNTLLLGLQNEIETLRADTTTAENGNRAGYLELQSNPLPDLFLVANARVDDNDRFGGVNTWRVSPAYIVPATGTKLKASYGTAFKAPTLTQLFVDFPAFNFFANPNLQPEHSTGYDAGFEQPLFGDRLRFGATYFHNDITNLIAANATFTTNINVGRATTEGVEAFAAMIVTDRVKIRGDYTYTEARDDTTGLRLIRRPRHKASLTATWNLWDELVLSATVLHVGSWIDGNRNFTIPRLTAPGYTTVNLAANYTVNKHTKVFARVDNLFDVEYQEPTGFLRPGLGVFGGVKLTN